MRKVAEVGESRPDLVFLTPPDALNCSDWGLALEVGFQKCLPTSIVCTCGLDWALGMMLAITCSSQVGPAFLISCHRQ